MKTHKKYLHAVTVSLFIGALTVLQPASARALVLVVTNSDDSGAGSLRQAIALANGSPSADVITFDSAVFSLAAPATITVGSTTGNRLPRLTGAGDSIDATGSGVIIDGTSLMDGVDDESDHGLRIQASNFTVRALVIQNFPGDGIRVAPNGNDPTTPIVNVLIDTNTISGNLDAIRVSGDDDVTSSVDATISGNLVIDNLDDGIFVQGGLGATANTITVNILGNTIKGSEGIKTGGLRSGDGIRVVGGRLGGSGHTVSAVISNNTTWENIDDGIVVAGAGGDGTESSNIVDAIIVGNLVRGRPNSPAARGNGIVVRGGQRGDVTVADSQLNMVTFDVSNNRIFNTKDFGISITGGQGMSHTVSGVAFGNVIHDTGDDGIRITGASGSGNVLTNITVQGNRISRSSQDGLQVTGGSGSGNTVSGILIDNNRSERNMGRGFAITQGSGGGSVAISGLTGNLAVANSGDGMFVGGNVPGSNTAVSGNESNRNGEDGIDINSAGYVLSNNSARRNAADGINAVDGNVNGGGNTATGNASCNDSVCIP